MQQITKISAEVLKVHPRNQEFFDDIEGKDYEQFRKSIEEDGIITPLIVAPDMTVVSGHQRLKAATDLGIKQIPVIIREDLEDEDEKLKKLLATNFGRMKNDEVKQRKVAVQYVELCGYKRGGDRKSNSDNRSLNLSQEEIAKQLNVSVSTLNEMIAIERKLTPEIKELLDTGKITKTSASKIWTKLSPQEQAELLEELGKDKLQEMTQNQLQEYVKEKQALENTYNELSNKYSKLEQELELEKSKEPVIEEIIVDNTDRVSIERLNRELETKTKLYNLAKEKEETYKNQLELYEKDSIKYNELVRQIEVLTKEKDDIGRAVKSATELSGYIYEVENFLKTKLAPVNYSRALIDCKDNQVVIKNVKDIVECVEKWCFEIRKYLPNDQQNIINVDFNEVNEIIDIEGEF